MSSLNLTPVFKEIAPLVGGQIFSTMYFGGHCGKNLLILRHESMTLMLVFKYNDDSLTPEFIKSVSSRDNYMKKTVEIVGNENVILLLDEDGNLWSLINAFEFSDQKDECLYLLDKTCCYEWVPFKSFDFKKVFALSAFGQGFACIGINKTSEVKLKAFSSTCVEDYTFDQLIFRDSANYYLMNVNNYKNNEEPPVNEALFVTDQVSGKSYICCKGGQNFLLNTSSIFLISALTLEEGKCLLLCYQNGKLIFNFYSDSSYCVAYLMKKVVFVKKCHCGTCIVWSDGVSLHHTKFILGKNVQLLEMPVDPNIRGVMSYLNVHTGGIAVTVNNFYYHILGNTYSPEKKAQKEPDQLLCDIYQGSLKINDLNKKIETVKNFLEYKEIIQMSDEIKKIEVDIEGRFLTLKSNVQKIFKKEFWRIKFLQVAKDKQIVKTVNLETDVSEGLSVRMEIPFEIKSNIRVSFLGDFHEAYELLFLKLKEIMQEVEEGKEEVHNKLNQIAIKRNPHFKNKQVFV